MKISNLKSDLKSSYTRSLRERCDDNWQQSRQFLCLYIPLVIEGCRPSGYGELIIHSLIGLFSITFGFLGLVIVKFSSDEGRRNTIFLFVGEPEKFNCGFVFALVVFFASGPLSSFLNVSLASMFLSAPLFFVLFLGFIYTSYRERLDLEEWLSLLILDSLGDLFGVYSCI